MEDPGQHGANHQNGRRNGMDGKSRNRRNGFISELRKSQLPKRYGGQVHHTGTARLLFSINMVHVFVRMFRYPVVRLFEQLVPLSVNERVRGTGLYAGRYGYILV